MGLKCVAERQQGVVLVITLILLLELTILAVNAMGSLILEEKMAANARQTMVAEQAAEIALRAGEGWVRENVLMAADIFKFWAGVSGYYSQVAPLNPPPAAFNISDAATWPAHSVAVSMTGINPRGAKTSLLAQNPRYIVEYLGRISDEYVDDVPGISGVEGVDRRHYAFRVTAVGWGENSHARFLVQSTYRSQLRDQTQQNGNLARLSRRISWTHLDSQ
jgi:type IV pilus assembly protein PilX